MNDPYESCYGCRRRLTGGENCHNAEYCPGWGYREAQKAERYAQNEARVRDYPEVGSVQKRNMKKKERREKLK